MSQKDIESLEIIVKQLSRVNMNDTTMEVIAQQVRELQGQIATLTQQITALDNPTRVEEFQEIQVNISDSDVSQIWLEMFKSLSEFSGDRNKYSAWRNSAMNVMKIFVEHKSTPKYFEALNIVRNKIEDAEN